MKIFLQWAKAAAEDWAPVEVGRAQHVRNLPRRPVPTAASVVDNQPGWYCGLNCQGIDFSGYDHLAIEYITGNGLRITGWQDDEDDIPTDERYATEWTLMPPAPDLNLPLLPALRAQDAWYMEQRPGSWANVAGSPYKINTVQTRRVFAAPGAAGYFPGVPILPWEDFVAPPEDLTLHGIWLPDAAFRAHQQVRTPHGWREWIT